MVSDGKEFKLWIPPKNRFVIGRNDAETPNPKQPLENVRPQNLYEALLIREIDPEKEIAVLENGYETVLDQQASSVRAAGLRNCGDTEGQERLVPVAQDYLQPDRPADHRQKIYNEQGILATDVHYGEYKDYDGISFPKQIEIERPQEEYDITLNMVKLELNKPLTDDSLICSSHPAQKWSASASQKANR